MCCDSINVTKVFKPSGKNVRVLLISSTDDLVGELAISAVSNNLHKDVEVVNELRVSDFRELYSVVNDSGDFNVLVFVAHGKEEDNTTKLFADFDESGRPLRLNVGGLAAVLQDKVSDVLCLFGVCYFGTEDLAEAICNQVGALACIAPKPDYAIEYNEIGSVFSLLLNKIQESKHMDFDIDLLHEYLLPCLDQNLLKELSIFPAKV